jgi:hypothetical protein
MTDEVNLAVQVQVLATQLQSMHTEMEQLRTRNGQLKLPKPETFTGRTSATEWLAGLRRYFRTITGYNDQELIVYASALLREAAGTWWLHLESTGRSMEIATWGQFEEALLKEFEPINPRELARDRLAAIRQRPKESVQSYTTNFRRILAHLPELTEDEKVDRYKRGLLPGAVQKEVFQRNPNTLDNAIQIAERLEAGERQARSWGLNSNRTWWTPSFQHSMDSSNVQTSRPTPMELGSVERPRRSLPSSKSKKNFRCYNCQGLGHFARDCKFPRKAGSRTKALHVVDEEEQVNVLDSDQVNPADMELMFAEVNTSLLKFAGKAHNQNVSVLVDGGATGNFISEEIIQRLPEAKIYDYEGPNVVLANGTKQQLTQMAFVRLKVGMYQDTLRFEIMSLGPTCDLILGKPWLSHYNPIIDWRTNHLRFKQGNKAITWKPPLTVSNIFHQPIDIISPSQVDRMLSDGETEYMYLAFVQDNAAGQDETVTDSQLQQILNDYATVFPTELPHGLPPVRSVDHTIMLECHRGCTWTWSCLAFRDKA